MAGIVSRNWTIAALMSANKSAGQFFFSPGAMKAFNSRIDSRVYEGPGGIYFCTSEQFEDLKGRRPFPRTYKVRRFDSETGHVWSTYPATEYKTIQEAREAAKALARG